MSPSPITGFVKKKVAAKKYKRSARQLTRDITVAMELKDDDVLKHLKLRTADGEVFDGGEVTTELVTRLHKADGRNPMWYLRRTWLEEAFGRRDESSDDLALSASVEPSEPPAAAAPSVSAGDDDVRALLREAVTELRGERDFLKSQIEAKDKQLNAALERDRESNVLLKNLQELMGNLQEELLALPTSKTGAARTSDTATVETPVTPSAESRASHPVHVQDADEVKPVAPAKSAPRRKTARKKSGAAKKKSTGTRTRSAPRKKTPPPSFAKKHLPTFSRFFTSKK